MDHHNVPIIYFAIISYYYAQRLRYIIRSNKVHLWEIKKCIQEWERGDKPSDRQETVWRLQYVGGVVVAEPGEYSPRVSSPPPSVPLESQVFTRLFTSFYLHFSLQNYDREYQSNFTKYIPLQPCPTMFILFLYKKCYWWSFLSISRPSSY